jgi:hypothetical protein
MAKAGAHCHIVTCDAFFTFDVVVGFIIVIIVVVVVVVDWL